MIRRHAAPHFLAGTILFLASILTQAQQSEVFGDYELHYSVVNSTFISPEVAREYGIVRGDDRAFVNLALSERDPESAVSTVPMVLSGESWDLTGQRTYFDFQEIREGSAVYYVGEFRFLNREWRHFQIRFGPRGGAESFEYRFKRQMFREWE